jgi:hypothetical protein
MDAVLSQLIAKFKGVNDGLALRVTTLLDFMHVRFLLKATTFRRLILLPSSRDRWEDKTLPFGALV